MNSIPLGFYVDKQSVVHSFPALWKFPLLLFFIIGGSIAASTPVHGLILVGIAVVFRALRDFFEDPEEIAEYMMDVMMDNKGES